MLKRSGTVIGASMRILVRAAIPVSVILKQPPQRQKQTIPVTAVSAAAMANAVPVPELVCGLAAAAAVPADVGPATEKAARSKTKNGRTAIPVADPENVQPAVEPERIPAPSAMVIHIATPAAAVGKAESPD